MLRLLVVMMALAARPGGPALPVRPGPSPTVNHAARPAVAAGSRFTRLNCAIDYYHYRIFSLHVAGGYSLNLPLTVFIDDETQFATPARPEEESAVDQQPVFSMPLLRDVTIGYQSRDKAFFISWHKRFPRPRVQLYFKLWM